MNANPNPSNGGGKSKTSVHLKKAAIDLFKKSQRLPPLSSLLKKGGAAKMLPRPPHALEFADFYHL